MATCCNNVTPDGSISEYTCSDGSTPFEEWGPKDGVFCQWQESGVIYSETYDCMYAKGIYKVRMHF